MFVDVADQRIAVEDVVATFQELPHRLTDTKYLLVRWPDIARVASADYAVDAECQAWIDLIADRSAAVGYEQIYTGAVRFTVGRPPKIIWSSVSPEPASAEDAEATLLGRALRVELRTLLDAGHAIWRPTDYHYQLPSGEHAGAFIRVGDAFRSPRDVRVLTSWIAARLRDQMAIAADSATLVPLITDLQAVMGGQGWTPGRVEMLDEYPRTRLDIARAVQPLAQSPGGILGLLSVNSSGRYRGLMQEVLADCAPDNWSLVVLVDKTSSGYDRDLASIPSGSDVDRVATWTSVRDQALDQVEAGRCAWCRDNLRAPVVRIDPRSFEAVALPGEAFMMPDTVAARATLGFWENCFATAAIGVQCDPASGASLVARPKSTLMAVRIHLDRLLSDPEKLVATIATRVTDIQRSAASRQGNHLDQRKPLDFTGCDAVLVSADERRLPGYDALYAGLVPILSLGSAPLLQMHPVDSAPAEIDDCTNVVILALGNVTGWSMRQMMLAVRDRWQGKHDRTLSGVVINTRPSARREWINLTRSFENRLDAIWETYLPWGSPLDDEAVQLRQFATEEVLEGLSEEARAFAEDRRLICGPRVREWIERLHEVDEDPGNVPDPRALFWGSPPAGTGRARVRNQSLYGFEVDAITAYAAVGAAMHSSRLRSASQDPRQAVFEMPAVSRSYYDAIILACILRWAQPQECGWGGDDREASRVMTELLARTQEEGDRKILLPELLLAAAQGKVPHPAAQELVSEAEAAMRQWEVTDRAPLELGLALLRKASIRPLD